MTDEERRRYPRAEAHLEAKVTVLPSNVEISVPTLNVSGGGLRLSLKEPVAPKQRIFLELEVPGQDVISMYGEVVWSDPCAPSGLGTEVSCEVGVRIIQVSSFGRETIKQYVASKRSF